MKQGSKMLYYLTQQVPGCKQGRKEEGRAASFAATGTASGKEGAPALLDLVSRQLS